ncbi:nicotinate phosphoribosyltransferase [bacterium]|nr:nicotinate phosphoribosyltransferase [bacterium]
MVVNDFNRTLLTDLYQLTMMNGYFSQGISERKAVFELFFRTNPFSGGYCVAAGLEDVLSFVESIHFSSGDLDFIRSLGLFQPDFVDRIASLKFSGKIKAVQEGSIVFPNEPIISVSGTLLESQFLETFFLNSINFQTLIATKAARIWEASGRGTLVEFGLRRAQGVNGAITATRASFIGGCQGTTNVLAGKIFDIPLWGSMSHSWVLAFPSELEAFRAFVKVYPRNSILLVDTFDTLQEGLQNAITVGRELFGQGNSLLGIRLDSGDLTFLSQEARRMLDSSGLPNVKIVASNSLNEWIIETLKHQGALIDIWGVGTNLVTGGNESSLGGVYKLVSVEGADGKMHPKMKISQNIEKITLPGEKNVFRIFDSNNFMIADYITLGDEPLPTSFPFKIHHPQIEHKFSRMESPHRLEPILVEVFKDGHRIFPESTLKSIQARTISELDKLHPSHRRLTNPHTYKVGLSQRLWELKQSQIEETVGSLS